MMRNFLVLLFLLPVFSFKASAQIERSDIRKGNKLYKEQKFSDAEVEYLRALGKTPNSYEANYNLGGAFFKQNRFSDAQNAFLKSSKDSTRFDMMPEALYNLGTSYLAEKKLDESIDALKNSLKLNPNDTLAKYNLAYAKFLKKEQDNKDNKDNQDNKDNKDNQDNKDNKDQNKENQDKDQNKDNQDQNKDKDDNKNDENPEDNKGDQDDQGDNKDDKSKPEPREGQMNEQEAEKLLEAMQAQEDKTKDKMDEKKKGIAVGRSGKNW